VTTDWILIHRAAAELERALAGGRVVDAGLLDDGRVGLRFASRPARSGKDGGRTLAIDAFAAPPVVTLEDAELAVRVEPGWLRSAGTTLRGTRLNAVRARPGDRVLALDFGTASRFGVETASQLVIELVPRYGNVVLLRNRTVVAAAKQFSPAENEARSVQVGLPYEPPPLPQPAALPKLLAASLAASPGGTAGELLAHAERAADELGDVYVYRDDAGAIVAAHVVPLAQYAALACTPVASLIDVFAEARASTLRARHGDATERRRAALAARIAKRATATDAEVAALETRLADVSARDDLRRRGDALFTYGHEVASGATSFVSPAESDLIIALDPELSPTENAQRYYARYRKAADALPHLERRRKVLAARRNALEELAFEVERAEPGTLAELEADLDVLEGRPQRPATSKAQITSNVRRRAPLRVDRPSGARIYVGRSPRENDEVTFRVARADDLWFHARGIPGSHVVLQAPSGAEPADEDLDAAADLAATHSKARNAPRVEIDYTERKHVRKQRDGAPGLVWYTNVRTRVGRPAGEEIGLARQR
jgi:predicted ribosome quality control (RQC) complex YloA/Tae2 family protein